MKNILTKINKIRAEINVEKEQGRYKAFTVAKLNAELNPLLIKHNLGVSFNIKENNVVSHDREGKNPLFTISGTITYSIFDLDSDERLDIDTVFTGLNSEGDPSKSQGNAHSYSYKYLWVTLLGLTDEESDVDSPINQNKPQTTTQAPIRKGGASSFLANSKQLIDNPYNQ